MSSLEMDEVLTICVATLDSIIPVIFNHTETAGLNDFKKIINGIADSYHHCYVDYHNVKFALKKTEEDFASLENDCIEDVHLKYEENLAIVSEKSKIPENPAIKRLKNVGQDVDEPRGVTEIAFEPPIDPINKLPIRNPSKNTVCGHIYETSTILTMIRKQNFHSCPYIGCNNTKLCIPQIIEDRNLKTRIDEYFSHLLFEQT